MEAKKDNRGGKRPGSGRKKKDHKTIVISFRVRSEMAEEIKELVQKKLSELSAD